MQRGRPIARQRRQIASVRNRITSGGRLETPVGGLPASLSAAIPNVTREVMHATVAALDRVAIAGPIAIAISEPLVVLERAGRRGNSPVTPDRSIRGLHGTIP
jgi:hypothetical protein